MIKWSAKLRSVSISRLKRSVTFSCERYHLVTISISHPNKIVVSDGDSVTISDRAASPRIDEFSIFVEHDHGWIYALKHVDAILRIHSHLTHEVKAQVL